MKRLVARRRQLVVLLALFAGCAKTVPPTSTIHDVSGGGARGHVVATYEGQASWYGKEQHHHLTANGERFDMYALTAAHRTLHMQTRVRVINLRNGRDVVVRINDRGPYSPKRIIDVSFAAAKQLGMLEAGVVPVRIEVLAP